MQKDLTLLILAAGMGSRFGSLKQIEPVGPWGEFIIDYSVYDAKKAGFNKIVFVIKEENYYDFKDTIGKRVEDKIQVEYVFQKLEDLPVGYKFPERKKPWGTAHAIRAAKKVINEPFALISADDFYGRDAFVKLANFLKEKENTDLEYAVIGYPLNSTLTQNGTVKRGLCVASGDKLVSLVESEVRKDDDNIYARPLKETEEKQIPNDTLASMLMFGFTPTIFDVIEAEFPNFLSNNKELNETKEFLLPDVLGKMIDNNICNVKLIKTTGTWYGVTYKEDKDIVVSAIKKMISDQVYSDKLWSEK